MASDSGKPRIVLYGAGGHGKVVVDILEKQGRFVIEGFLDDTREAPHDATWYGYPIVGGKDQLGELRDRGVAVAIASVGDAALREEFDDRLLGAGFELGTAIHPSAQIARGVNIEGGSAIMPGAVIGPDVKIERSGIINTGASVDHDCVLGSYAHVAPGARLAGNVTVGNGAMIGIGASVRQQIRLGDRSILGAGAVLVSDLPDGVVAVGVPAKVVRNA